MTPEDSQLTIIVPAYNEAASLPQLIHELLPFAQLKNFKVIIVNDGSKDDTRAVLERSTTLSENISIINHKVNRGYGGALKSGINKARTQYCITIDADGQHSLSDIDRLLNTITETNADLVIGSRKGNSESGYYREFGKTILRWVAKLLMPLKIYDINSGIKIYDTKLAQKYIQICPDSMAFSDVIALTFVYQRNLVLEIPVKINQRKAGKSTIGMRTAFETLIEIINIVVLFNPMRIFLPLSFIFILASIIWEIPIFLSGQGVSIGALLGFMTGIIFFLLGLIAEQLGNIRRLNINENMPPKSNNS
jgi:glycosyltransferase involved in cell wall biosynthesis